MRVAFLPESNRWRINPYLDLLASSLRELGVDVEYIGSDYLSGRWLIQHRRTVDVLHFHWIQYHYVRGDSHGVWRNLIGFVGRIMLARLLGYRLVWTAHNLLPHELAQGNIDVVARRAMVLLAHRVLVLCEAGRQQLAERFGRRKGVCVTPHGHYIGAYPVGSSRTQARTNLGLAPEDVVYLFFGGVRPHKNVEVLMQVFADMPGENLRLLVVGFPHGEEIRQRVLQRAATDSRIVTVLGLVPDTEIQCYMKAADIVVLPFARILSSGSAMLAMSFGRPVIVPAAGCLPEWVTPDCGFLYNPADSDGLYQAMCAAQHVDLTKMGETAYQQALMFSWDFVARQTLAAYCITR